MGTSPFASSLNSWKSVSLSVSWLNTECPLTPSRAPIGAHLVAPLGTHPGASPRRGELQILFDQSLADAYLELIRPWFSSLQSLSPRCEAPWMRGSGRSPSSPTPRNGPVCSERDHGLEMAIRSGTESDS